MKIAVIGCGYVAESYGLTLSNYPELELVGAYDRQEENLAAFSRRWPCRLYGSLEQVLDDPDVELVLNLTNPRSHYEVTKKCLSAGKHVYSEKPLAMDFHDGKELADLAKSKGCYLAAAPCSLLSETAQTIWKALAEGVIGRVRLVYANFDDGMIAPKQSPWEWQNGLGVPWPAKDEFEVGCTYEHAGYVLSWLAAFFGPARSVTSFASCQIPDKGIHVEQMAPDFSVGCLEYGEGVVARVTCSLVAPRDKSLSIVGDDGVISTSNVRNDAGPVFLRRFSTNGQSFIARRLNRVKSWMQGVSVNSGGPQHRLRLVRKPPQLLNGHKPVDFCRGPAEMAEAIKEGRACRLSTGLALHLTELIEALQYPERFGGRKIIESRFEPIDPLPWNR